MSELERWVYLDGPEPDLVRPVVEELSAPEPTPEEEERMVLGALARLDARLSSRGLSAAVLLDDAEVESAPPSPGAPEAVRVPCLVFADAPPLQKKEEEAPAPPVVARWPSSLKETANSFGAAPPVQPALSASGVRPAPEVRVADVKEHPRTAQLPVMDPTQGARHAAPKMTLYDYVAYRTQVELWPEHSAHFREKYKVDGEAGHQELVREWDRRLAAAPTMRAEADRLQASWLKEGRAMQQEAPSGGT